MTGGDFSFSASGVECLDLSRSKLPISTGVGFLDHMVDQLNSHAQVGVAISIDESRFGGSCLSEETSRNRFSELDQSVLLPFVGSKLGQGLRQLLQTNGIPIGRTSRFCCPLDEALVECQLTLTSSDGEGRLSNFTLSPYGIFPKPSGRTKIGEMETKNVEGFFRSLAQDSGLEIHVNKIRGDNGHHIVESAFKAFSRALRNLLDGTSVSTTTDMTAFDNLWGRSSESWKQSSELQRIGKVDRKTKETNILVDLSLDGGSQGVSIDTGVPCLDEFFDQLARAAQLSLTIKCKGDIWVDDHHTSEDVAIAVGQVLTGAFGSKAGLNRMWCSKAVYGEAEVEVTMDLSNRPCLTHDLSLHDDEYVEGTLTAEMMDHVLESLVMNARMTVHIVEHKRGATTKETVMAAAKAFGQALQMCSAVDPRRAGKTASSKGTLSV